MAKFRKKPVEVEAWPVDHLIADAKHSWHKLPKQILDAYESGNLVFLPDSISINTLEGTVKSGPTDFIICGVAGELYPCKRDIFLATYDVVTD